MKNKKYMIVTTVVTLLPVLVGLLLWDRLPEKLPTHFGIDGAADGWSGKGFGVFGVPLILLLFHWICYACTLLDKQNQGHNRKVLDLVGLIFPGLSVFFGVLIYSHALDLEVDFGRFLFPMMGLIFILVGNWLPKIKQNTTLGIKLKWTLYNEENWNKTHRIGGYTWVIGGLIFCVMGFVTGHMLLWLLPANLVLMMGVPILYSWSLARKQKQAGTYTESEVSKRLKQHPVILGISMALVVVILAVVGVIMFTGDVDYTCTETALVIEADYWSDSTIPYEKIDSIEFRDHAPVGTREWGWGSARLLLGFFSNDEFGGHTRYSYTGTDAHIVLHCGDDVLVLNAETETATKALYEALLAQTEEKNQSSGNPSCRQLKGLLQYAVSESTAISKS